MRRKVMLLLAGVCCLSVATGCDWNVTVRHLLNNGSLTSSSFDSASVDIAPSLSDMVDTEGFPTRPLTEEEYEQRIIAYQKDFTKAFNDLVKLRENTYSAIGNVWLDEQDWYLDQIYMVMNNYRELTPPASYQEIQDKYVEAMDKFEEGLILYRQGYVKSSSQLIESSRAPIQKGQDLWNYAYSRLRITTELPVGDGSLTTKDLREMELLVGIDRESVLLNVSEDGKELIGRWGQPNQEGNINPSIVFHAQHSYEECTNGQYPYTSNVTFGRWEYDYLTGVVTIYVHAVYEDGENIGPVDQKQQRYEVQRFKDNQLQLMNLDTLQTVEYTKITG